MNHVGEEKYIRMTTEPVDKLISELAVPTVISMLVTSFYNLADTFYVRQLENDSMVAAVGVALPLMTVIQAIGYYHGHGSGNYISRAFGRQDYQDAENMAAAGFFYAFFLGAVLAGVGLLFRRELAVFLGARTEATLENTISYITYILLAMPFMSCALVLNNQLRHQGNAVFSMIGLCTGAVVNLILDPLLIFAGGQSVFSGSVTVPFGAGMGVAGASLATGISQILSFFLLLVGIYRSDSAKIRLRNLRFRLYYIKQILKGGLPSLARQSMASVAVVCMNHAIGIYMVSGTMIDAVQAAMTGVSKAMGFVSSALLGLGQGFQPVCGFNYGAGKYDRVLGAFAAGLRKALLVMVSLSVFGFIFADGISGLVAGASPEAIRIASFTLRTQLLTLPFLVYVVFSNMLLQNIGSTGGATLVALSRQGLTYAPTVLLLPLVLRSLGLEPVLGLELSQAAADLMAFVIALPIGLRTLRRLRGLADAAADSGCSA